MNDLRELRRGAGLSQREFAKLVGAARNSFRMWDSGLRPVPAPMLLRAREALNNHDHQNELLPLDRLSSELGVHVRTLQAAARTGRLDVQFLYEIRVRSAGPVGLASGGRAVQAHHYRRFAGQAVCAAPLPAVPADYDEQLKRLRRQQRLTQEGLARRIGAARKAVVYQWESRKRTPSPVFWQRIQALS